MAEENVIFFYEKSLLGPVSEMTYINVLSGTLNSTIPLLGILINISFSTKPLTTSSV